MKFVKLWMAVGFLSGALFLGCGGDDDSSGSLLDQQVQPTSGVPPKDLTGSYQLTYSFGQSTCTQDIVSAIQDSLPVNVSFSTVSQDGTEIVVEIDEFFSTIDVEDQLMGSVSGNGMVFGFEGSETSDDGGCTISGEERLVLFVSEDGTVTGTDVGRVTISGNCGFPNQTCELQLNIEGERTAEVASVEGVLTSTNQKFRKRSLWAILSEY